MPGPTVDAVPQIDMFPLSVLPLLTTLFPAKISRTMRLFPPSLDFLSPPSPAPVSPYKGNHVDNSVPNSCGRDNGLRTDDP